MRLTLKALVRQAAPLPPDLLEIVFRYQKQEVDITLFQYPSPEGYWLELAAIVIPFNLRGRGLGSKFMTELTSWADLNKQSIFLTPEITFGGTSVTRLKAWYRGFGFKPNSGRRRDFRSRCSMVRHPKGSV